MPAIIITWSMQQLMSFAQVCTVAQLVACDSMKKIVALQHSLGMDRQAICMYVVDFCFICLDSEYKQRCCEGDSSVPPEMEPEALAFEVATLVHGVTDDAAALFTDILADPQALNSSKWKGCMGCRMDVISSAVKLIGQQVGHRLGRTLAVFLQMMLQKERLKVRHQSSRVCVLPALMPPTPTTSPIQNKRISCSHLQQLSSISIDEFMRPTK